MPVRLIARLDIKGPNLVKGVHLEGLRVLGKPERFARQYYEDGVDELLYMDVAASLYGRSSLLEIIERTSRDIFVPLTVGGGLRSIDDMRAVLSAGADKVSLNTPAIRRPELIREAARRFGSSAITISVEAKRKPDGSYEAFTDHGRERSGVEVFAWARQAVELGAGELVITSIDREGTGRGFDLELTRRISQSVDVPVIACGGAGRVAHVTDVLTVGGADAVCVASLLHYRYVGSRVTDGDFSTEGNVEYLRAGGPFTRVEPATVADIRAHLKASGVACRHHQPGAVA